jgi:hypothetical protein
MELTNKHIERQDFVDNEIQDLIVKLNPTNIKIDWDIENIADIRETLRKLFTTKLNLCTELEFYPFIQDTNGD